MQAFMWQDNLIGIAKFVNARMHEQDESIPHGQASDQPGVAGRISMRSHMVSPLLDWHYWYVV